MSLRDDKRREPRQERSVERRRRILHATAVLLNTVDYAALNVGEIARHAGTSVGSIYQYFPNKDAVLQALAEQYLEEMRESSEAVFAPSTTPVNQRVEQAVDWLVTYAETHPGFNHVLKSEWVSPALRAAVEGVFNSIHRAVSAIIGQGMPHLSMRQRDVCAYVVMGMMWGVLDKLTHTPPDFQSDIVAELKRAVVGYLSEAARVD